MLGPTKWRLLTIVAGILLAHAIESPNSKSQHKLNAPVRSFTNAELGLRIEQISPWSTGRSVPARNLLVPHQLFSRADDIRYIDARTPNSRHLPGTFGAFRFVAPASEAPATPGGSVQRRRSKAFQMRRSDDTEPEPAVTAVSVLPSPEQDQQDAWGGQLNVSRVQRQHRYKIIPISYFYREEPQPELKPITPSLPPKDTENDEPARDARLPQTTDETGATAEPEDHQPTAEGASYSRADTPVIGARRSGIRFPDTLKAVKSFTPQGYSEESLTLGDNLGIFQQPVNTADEFPADFDEGRQRAADIDGGSEFSRNLYANRFFRDFGRPPVISPADLRPAESLPRPSRLIEFPGAVGVKQPFRDDQVTKFGDVGGPVTAIQRPYVDFGDGKHFRTADPNYYTDSPYQPVGRPPYFPAKLYTEPNQKIYQPLWKTRSPRVVFPQGDLSSPSGFGVDNVVFR
ncbi:hypothetical protein ZHAS_00012792 [Anopheles sinensis]|uniref:Uncharacterized protein n=1 Tax=Anopheles sinensis TaxID=74873 RepID=A0A084W3T8_ANOSI|nr:hypothetical protein ZHAS_00012792 [Anopheles sinensis]